MTALYIGSDHAGYDLKEFLIPFLQNMGKEVVDLGTNSHDSCDYPLIAHKLCDETAANNGLGILICGSGIGMSIAANRHPQIRAALCSCEIQARLSRRHNNANVLCLGARLIGQELAMAIVIAFLESEFEGGRHLRRINQLNLT